MADLWDMNIEDNIYCPPRTEAWPECCLTGFSQIVPRG